MKLPEKYRSHRDDLPEDFPLFRIKSRFSNVPLTVVATDGSGWDHVSVSLPTRCPTWEEMCLVKSLFFDDEEAVMQLHPPQSDWVNNHEFCLHLWRSQTVPIPPASFHYGRYQRVPTALGGLLGRLADAIDSVGFQFGYQQLAKEFSQAYPPFLG